MTWLTDIGKGIAGVFLSFIGIGTIPTLFWYFENLKQVTGYSPYSEPTILVAIFVFPAIILIIGSISFYHGIKIIQKNN